MGFGKNINLESKHKDTILNNQKNILWSLKEVKDKKFPVFIKFLNQIPQDINTNTYQNLISIFWSYPVIDDTGLPSKEVNEAHSNIENIVDKLDDNIISFFVAEITGNGRKEWIIYTKNVDKLWSNLMQLLNGYPKYPLNIELDKEPNWETYRIISGNK